MASASLFSAYLQPAKSVLDYGREMDAADLGRLQLQGQVRQNEIGDLTAQQTRSTIADAAAKRNALQDIYTRLGPNADPAARATALQSNPLTAAEGVAAEKSLLDNKLTTANTSKAQAEADAKNAEAKFAAAQHHAQGLAYVRNLQDVQTYAQQGVDKGIFPPNAVQGMIDEAQKFGNIDAWRQHMEQGSIPVLEKYKIAAENARNAATNSTSRANNTATIAGENQRAGVMPGGGLDDNSERTAQAIAAGKLPPPTGMALLNPKNQRVLGRVMEINPQYDYTDVSAKNKAARDFTTGTLGNSMRSFAVAGQHLDQLNTLVDALRNNDTQLINKASNLYSQQTGSPAVTNFDAAKDVVSKEVIKAIVAGGGGVSEREELSKLMSNTKSPEQLKGVISQYRALMSAQHDALLQQRRAAGLSDDTLPKYAEPQTSTPDLMSAIDAELARRKK